jgi:Tol biopolymer transport system component
MFERLVSSFRVTLGACALWLGVAVPAGAGEVRFDGEGHAYHPIWSVDGKYLAFEVNRYAGNIDLYIAQVAGEVPKDGVRVSLPGGSNPFGGSGQVVVNPAWHKDGYAVFEGSNQGGQFRIYYRSATGGSAAELIPTTELPGDLTFPAVSGDGRAMIFVSDQTGAGDIRLRDTQTGKLSQLTKSPVAEMFPMFSGDASKVLFTRKHDGGEDVYEIVPSTGVETPIAGGSADQTRPAYAADGRVVFFDGARGQDKWDVVTALKGQKTTLARDVRLPLRARPALTPDGRWVAYAFSDPTQNNKIVISRVDGSKTVEIPTTFTACGEPALTSQGGRILLAFTALPNSGADWRFLYIMDVTSQLQ